MFRIYLLVSCICVLIASVIYTFYLNRIVSGFISILLRVKYWRKGSSSIWVHIGSIHFSILAGRILLKDVKYHSSNMTVKIVTAQISWRYWLRVPATEDDLNNAHVGGEDYNHTLSFPSCRVKVSIQGFEWLLYNKTAAYDHIITQMHAKTPHPEPAEPRRMFSRTSGAEGLGFYPPSALANIRAPPLIHAALAWIKRQTPYLDPNDILPIALEISKVAITCGNPSTPSLLVAECHRAEGTFGIVQARSKCDLYKQLLNLKFQEVLVQLVENDDYQGIMPTIGHGIREKAEESRFAELAPLVYLSFRAFSKVWRGLKLYSSLFRTSSIYDNRKPERIPEPMLSRKSAKSIDEDTLFGTDYMTLEYAIERRIIEAPLLELSYFVDIVGDVPNTQEGGSGIGLESYDIGNGDLPPEWGVDLVIRKGILRYGPWADRQRVHLQRAFFPPSYCDMETSKRLRPGDKRMWTAMKVFVELRDETVFNIPFREPSKNWQWDSIGEYPRARKRDHAALHCTAGDSSSISYLLPMVTGPDGYEPRLEVHLDTVSVTSSLNDIKLVAAESCRVHASFPSPLVWNAERCWSFSVSLRQPTIYLLRDHVNMFTDLTRDWTSGPPTRWDYFVPTIYVFELHLHQFELNLYANDQNIIDKPLVRGENTLVTIRAPSLSTKVTFPSNKFQPEATSIPFTVNIPDVAVSLSLPRWNTQYIYNSGKEHRVLHAATFSIASSYYFWSEVQAENIDQLKLTIETSHVAYKALGWSVRYFMVLRDNYLGNFTHFSTLVEYLEKRGKFPFSGDPLEMKYRPNKANSLQVQVSVLLQYGSMLLPAGLPGYEVSIASDRSLDNIGASTIMICPELQLDLRLHDYFMDMSLNLNTVRGSLLDACSECEFFGQGDQCYRESFLIDGLNVSANRLFGPQPRTRTYVCMWEIGVGQMKALLTSHDGRILMASFNAFRLNYADLANAPSMEFVVPADPDVTFIRFSTGLVNVTWSAGTTAVNLSLPSGLSVHTNDLQGQFCSKLMSVRLPTVSLKILLSPSVSRKTWCEAADLTADINMDVYKPSKIREPSQMNFIQEQDKLTCRTQHLLAQLQSARRASFSANRRSSERKFFGLHRNGLYLPPPRLPHFREAKLHPSAQPTIALHSRDTTAWWPYLSHLAESEEEEMISDADRDARLARGRLPLPITVDDVDDEISVSGEESDDEDLTDAESSASGYSSTRSRAERQSLFKRYRRFTRWYQSTNLSNLDSWEGSPFLVTKEPRIAIQKGQYSSRIRPFEQSNERTNHAHYTTFRIQCKRQILVRSNPLVLSAVTDLIDDLESQRLSPELTLDSVMASHMTQFSDSFESSSSTAFDIIMHSIHIQMFEHVSYSGSSFFKEASVQRDSIVIVNCFASGGRFIMSKEDQKWGCHVEISESSFGMTDGLGVTLGSSKSSHANNPILSIRSLRLDTTQDQANLSVGRFAVELRPISLESVITIFQALREDLHDLPLKRFAQIGSTTCLAEIVYRTLDLTRDKAAVDPLSTIQPSFLIQRGHPQALRTDATYKFLFHLRTALPVARLRGNINITNQSPSASDVKSLVDRCLADLEVDLDFSREGIPGPLELIHPRISQKSMTSPQATVSSANLSADLISIIIPDESSTSASRLDISSCALRFRSSKLAHTFEEIQLPLQSPDTTIIPQAMCALAIGDINVIVVPHLMVFAQYSLRLWRVSDKWRPESNQVLSSSAPSYLVFTAILHSINIRAAAEKLAFEIGATNMYFSLSLLRQADTLMHADIHSIGCTAGFSRAFIRARATSVRPGIWVRDQDILASLIFSGSCNVLWRQESSASNIRLAFLLRNATFSVPRSALRLYHFMEEWRADFFPGIEAATRAFLAELKESREIAQQTPQPHSRAVKKNALVAHVTGRISEFEVSLQVMRGTWLSWSIREPTAFLSSSNGTRSKSIQSFGLQFGTQTLAISHKLQSTDDHTDIPRIKVTLPSLSLTGRTGRTLRILASVDFFDVLIKPSHWDTLLVVQQKFGQDFTDLMDLIHHSRQRRSDTSAAASNAARSPSSFTGHVNVKGFRFGLEGRSSTSYLECEDVGGDISSNDSGIAWRIRLRDLALSLAPRTGVTSQETTFNRDHRTAFVVVDVHAKGSANTLDFRIPKIHAVMQPSSIGEIGDFLDHQQAELLIRRDQRAAELATFKEKTRSVLKTFDMRTSEDIHDQRPSWLSERTIDAVIEKVSVAFPLSLEQTVELPRTSSGNGPSVRAFLFAIRHIKFNSQRGQAGHMSTEDLSFQFVPSFRQSSSKDFEADRHRSRNRLLYPFMTARLRSDTSLLSRHVWFSGNVSGFILDLDPSIPDYIFSLIDVYRQGRERMYRITTSLPRTTVSHGDPIRDGASLQGGQQNTPASNIFAKLVFQSGEVHLHSDVGRTYTPPLVHQLSGSQVRPEQEILRLPEISAWVEYRASGIRVTGPATLIFKSTIHPSGNTLRPSLLPFITEIVDYVQLHLRKTIREDTFQVASSPELSSSNRLENLSEASSSLQISFSLRIDKSKLELTCQPDVNVVAALEWESGGFLLHISPGARDVTFTGTVDGLTIGLKHGFLSDDCVNIEARNLAFALAFTKVKDRIGNIDSKVSLVMGTDISGGVRFSRLQDILCFKAVWLDRIPLFVAEQTISEKTRQSTATSPVPTSMVKQEVTTAVIINIRRVHLEVDLGQSISNITLELQNALIRMCFSELSTEVSLSVAAVSILARGNVAGRINVPDCVFQTIRRNEGTVFDDSRTAKMLELSMTSGPLSAELQLDHQRLLVYKADPVQVDIHDDWSLVSSTDRGQDRPLLLAFTVNGKEITVLATIATIPKLLLYVNKFQANITAQREGASQESAAFRATQSPKPDNPLTEVASAFFQSARNRFKEADTDLFRRIRQQLSFRLETLRLVLFPRSMGDTELAQFVGRDVYASLERAVTEGRPPHREICLSFTALTVSKFSQPQPFLPSATAVSDDKSWIEQLFKHSTEAIIVGLPTMKMLMFTDEVVEALARRIDYEFYSSFVRGKNTVEHEDIFITLNVALYSWLTGLRKNLTRELDQVRGSQDWRNTAVSPFPRKRAGATELPDVSHNMDASSPTSPITNASVQKTLLPDPLDISALATTAAKSVPLAYKSRDRKIERLTMRQLGEATPDVMHPFFMKTAGFNLEDSLPQYVHEYATIPLEEIMEALLKLYSKQLRADKGRVKIE